jgi:hypothetical protein
MFVTGSKVMAVLLMEGGHHQQLKIELANGNRREATCCLNLDRLNSIITPPPPSPHTLVNITISINIVPYL